MHPRDTRRRWLGNIVEPAARHKPWRHGFLPLTVDQYLELLDWTGRQLIAGKRGAIDDSYPPILERIGLQPAVWLEVIDKFDVWFHGAVGRAEKLLEHATRTGRHGSRVSAPVATSFVTFRRAALSASPFRPYFSADSGATCVLQRILSTRAAARATQPHRFADRSANKIGRQLLHLAQLPVLPSFASKRAWRCSLLFFVVL